MNQCRKCPREASPAWPDDAPSIKGLKVMSSLPYSVMQTALAAAQFSTDPWQDWASYKELGDKWLADALDVLAEKAP